MKYILNFIKGFFFVMWVELMVLVVMIVTKGDDSVLLTDSFRALLGAYFLCCIIGGGLYATVRR